MTSPKTGGHNGQKSRRTGSRIGLGSDLQSETNDVTKTKSNFRTVIIGSGFGGLISAIALKNRGLDNFTLYEREDNFGGTWYVNRFPGVAVDTESETYRLSYLPYNWSSSHASGAEVMGYMGHIVEKYDLARHIRCNSIVQSVRWDDADQVYRIALADGTTDTADAVISAVGLLSEPLIPQWPGLDSFAGKVVHTAQWDTALDYAGKRVAVVGTGSTAAQVVPEMAKTAASLLVFQRQPGWVLPKTVSDLGATPGPVRSAEEIAEHERRRVESLAFAVRVFGDGRINTVGSPENLMGQQQAEAFIAQSFADRPDLIPLVTPTYPFMGKRPVLSSDFYPALKRSNVTLIPKAVEAASATGLIDASGVEHEVDIVVLATGFTATQFLKSVVVSGQEGVSLDAFWDGEPRAYAGTMVPGFPNFFMIYGPNTNATGDLLGMMESEAEFAAATIDKLVTEGLRTASVNPLAFEDYNRWLEDCFAGTAVTTTRNYFTTASGRVVTNYPNSPTTFGKMLRKGREVGLFYDGRANQDYTPGLFADLADRQEDPSA